MKKIIVFMFLFIPLALFCIDTSSDFRNTNWGMNKEQVKKTEKLPIFSEDQDAILYFTKLLDYDVCIVYYFIDDKLYNATYITAKDFTNTGEYFSIYETFKNSITKKYGQGKEIKNILERSEGNQEMMNTELLMGNLTYMTQWQTDKTTIYCVLKGGNFKVAVSISYTGKAYQYLKDKQKAKEIDRDL